MRIRSAARNGDSTVRQILRRLGEAGGRGVRRCGGLRILGRLRIGRGSLDGVDNAAVILTGVPDQLEESGEGDVHAPEEGAVSAAAVHQVGWHLTAQLEPSLRDEAREPVDPLDLGLFRREAVSGGDMAGGTAAEDLQEVVAADGGDSEGCFEVGFPDQLMVVDEVEQFLGGAADGGEEGGVVGWKQGLRGPAAGLPGRETAIPHFTKPEVPSVVHGGEHAVELVPAQPWCDSVVR